MNKILNDLNVKIENIAECFLENREKVDCIYEHHYYNNSYKIRAHKNELKIFFSSHNQLESDYDESTSIIIDFSLLDSTPEITLDKYIKAEQEEEINKLKEIENRSKAKREKRYSDFKELKEEFDKENDSVLISREDFEELGKLQKIKNIF